MDDQRLAQLEHQVTLLSNAVEWMLRQATTGPDGIGRPEELLERIREARVEKEKQPD